jgi:hypothetical protein
VVEWPFVSETVIVVPAGPFVVVTAVTVNVPGDVSATVAIVVSWMTPLNVPVYPASLTVNVAVVSEQPDPTAAMTTGFGFSTKAADATGLGVGDGVGVAVDVAPVGVAVGVAVAMAVAVAVAEAIGVGDAVGPVLGRRSTAGLEHAASAAHAAIVDHVTVLVKICMNDPRSEAPGIGLSFSLRESTRQSYWGNPYVVRFLVRGCRQGRRVVEPGLSILCRACHAECVLVD